MPSRKIPILAVLLLLLSGSLFLASAQSSAIEGGESSEPGITLFETFSGESNTLGQIYKLDSNIGYNFNRWWGVDAGVPVYFLNPSSSAPFTARQSGSGLGNAYADLNIYLRTALFNYASTVEGSAPTGNKNLGLTTGRFTYDWNNHFDRSFHILTPFANLGYANTVTDTPLFTRPFTTFGNVFHFEGGAMTHVVPFVSLGGSFYDVAPTGEQRIYSRFTPSSMGTVHMAGNPNGRFFSGAHETIGGADLARDNGASIWGSVRLFRILEAQAGYARSTHYDLNTYSFGLGINAGRLLHIAP